MRVHSMRSALGSSLLLIALGLMGGCGEDYDINDMGQLQAALTSAQNGDTFTMAPGEYHVGGVPLEINAGVTLRAPDGGVKIVGPSDLVAPVLRVNGSAGSTTRLEGIEVVTANRLAILGKGEGGSLDLVDVHITVGAVGVGFGAEGLAHVGMQNVQVTGPIDAANAGSQPISGGATHGIVFVSVTDAVLDQVSVTGFAQFGALLVSTGTTWSGGSVSGNLSTGLMVYGGSARFEDVELGRAFQGSRLMPAYGSVFAGGANVTTIGVTARDSEAYGMLTADSTVMHMGLQAIDNTSAAVWVQDSTLTMAGDSMIANNAFAGVVGVNSTLDVSDAQILDTREMMRVIGAAPFKVGDGVHLIDAMSTVTLRGLDLVNNARVGLFVDLTNGDPENITVENVTVEADAASDYGAIVQNGELPPSWTSGIIRADALLERDAAFTGRLDAIVGPSDLPNLGARLDLEGIVGPSD